MVSQRTLIVVATVVVLLFFWGAYNLHTIVGDTADSEFERETHLNRIRTLETQRKDLETKLAIFSDQILIMNAQLAILSGNTTAPFPDAKSLAESQDSKALLQFSQDTQSVTNAAVEVLPGLHRIHHTIRQHQYSSDWVHRKLRDVLNKKAGDDAKTKELLQTAHDTISRVSQLITNPEHADQVRQSLKATNDLTQHLRSASTNADSINSYIQDLMDNNLDDLLADKIDQILSTTLFGVEVSKRATWLRDLLLEDIYYLQYPSLLTRFDGQRRGLAEARAAATELKSKKTLDYISEKACQTTNFLICDLSKSCGFGCQAHHLTYCLLVAYGTNRTLIIDGKNWIYAQGHGWEAVFQPISECDISHAQKQHSVHYLDSLSSATRVVMLGIIDGGPSQYAPSSIPKHYHNILMTFHSNPPVWWVGQFATFIFRPNKDMEQILEKKRQLISLEPPFVGIHVRRTDKIGTEASFHAIEEYMGPAEYYFDTHLQDQPSKKVFLASDEEQVVSDARSKYPDYKFMSDQKASKSAGLASRYSLESLRGIVSDVFLLSEAEYLVCTFSSQVCRLAFEIMQSRFVDASWRYTSLDDPWYFGGGNRELLRIWAKPQNQRKGGYIEVLEGDIIENHARYEGFYWKGFNRRTSETALYPACLAEPEPRNVPYPNYPNL